MNAPQGDALPVRAIPIADCVHDSDNFDREGKVDDLLLSLKNDGQKLPGLVSHHAAFAGKFAVHDGNRRLAALRQLGVSTFLAFVSEKPLSAREARKLKATLNGLRKNLTTREMGQMFWSELQETGGTQKDVARYFGFSESTVSKGLTCISLGEPYASLASELKGSTMAFVASKRAEARFEELFQYAVTKDKEGNLPSRAAVELFQKSLKPKAGAKRTILKGSFEGRDIAVKLKLNDTTEAVAASFEALAKKLRRYGELPPEDLGGLLA